MNSLQSLRTVDNASRHAEERPTESSTLPPTRPSLPPASLASLPPELLSHIFESTLWIDCNPPTSRAKFRKTLASLCLVNHLFIRIARPLLYLNVHLRFDEEDYNDSRTRLSQLSNTLLQAEHCARLVKEVQIDLSRCSSLEMAAVGYILSLIGPLERIRSHLNVHATQTEFARLILKHQPEIKHLELPENNLTKPDYASLIGGLKKLETLIGNFDRGRPPTTPLPDDLPSRLIRFVSTATLDPPTFEHLMASSWTTLTSLAFVAEPGQAQIDLGRLCNLNLLRVCLKDDPNGILYAGIATCSTFSLERRKALAPAFVQELRSTLRSAQSLPISTLSLGTYLDYVVDVLSPHLLFDLLPSSLQHLASPFDLLEPDGVNYSEFIKGFRSGRFPRFQRLTVVPSNYGGLWSGQYEEMRAASYRLKEPGILIDLRPHHEGGGTSWFNLDPYHVHNEDEREAEEEEEETSESWSSEDD